MEINNLWQPCTEKPGCPVGCRVSKIPPIDLSSPKTKKVKEFLKVRDILGDRNFELVF